MCKRPCFPLVALREDPCRSSLPLLYVLKAPTGGRAPWKGVRTRAVCKPWQRGKQHRSATFWCLDAGRSPCHWRPRGWEALRQAKVLHVRRAAAVQAAKARQRHGALREERWRAGHAARVRQLVLLPLHMKRSNKQPTAYGAVYWARMHNASPIGLEIVSSQAAHRKVEGWHIGQSMLFFLACPLSRRAGLHSLGMCALALPP